jgi:hypothetical protein
MTAAERIEALIDASESEFAGAKTPTRQAELMGTVALAGSRLLARQMDELVAEVALLRVEVGSLKLAKGKGKKKKK